ncbi:MAG: ribonuclease J [Bacilli bacterium]|nr:ribonuclease J [Bacilli bacterium]
MADRINVMGLGGLDENGRDCYIIEINDDIFVVDCGFALPDKTIPGVDAMLPNLNYLKENKSRIRAYFMTHGHDENMGALRFIYSSVPAPIYTTEDTMRIIKYQTIMSKLNVNLNFVVVNPNDTLLISNHKIDLFQTCHNSSNSFGVVFHTDQGNIVYTSDFIVDFTSGDNDFYFNVKKLEKLAEEETLLLMSESKAANKDGYCAPRHRVTNKISKFFLDDKRVFICCFWQNVFRIKEILNLVSVSHKKLYFYNEYTRKTVETLFPKLSEFGLNMNDVLSKEDLLRVRKEDTVVLLLGKGKDIYQEISLLSKGENEDKRLSISKDDIFINVALATPTLEVISTNSMDNLYRSGCQVVWLKNKDTISMHARQDDLKFFLSCLKPKYYLPVRGSFTQIMANAKLALSMNIGLNHSNVFVLDNGMSVSFDENRHVKIKTAEQNNVDTSPIILDGSAISNVASDIIEERSRLSIDGVVIIASTISRSSRTIIAGPDCQMRGFVFVKEAEPLLKSVTQIYVEEVEATLKSGSLNFEQTALTIKDRSKKYIKRDNGREPLVIPIIIQAE